MNDANSGVQSTGEPNTSDTHAQETCRLQETCTSGLVHDWLTSTYILHNTCTVL